MLRWAPQQVQRANLGMSGKVGLAIPPWVHIVARELLNRRGTLASDGRMAVLGSGLGQWDRLPGLIRERIPHLSRQHRVKQD